MLLVSGPFLAACALLAWSGGAKIVRPGSTSTAARAVGLPSSTAAVRAFGAVELGAACAGAAVGHAAALLVACVYAGLALVAVRLLRRAPAAPCGCLGASAAPVSRAHVALNIAAVLLAVAASSGGAPLAGITALPLAGVPFVVLVLCAARLAALTIDMLPALTRASGPGGQ
ncbi:MAG TPA: MauE/DoxX family redox-associated membrane protein [Acidimicrobiia bacterium]|nr:MauE/DoxX family redox-associated membrane protein [Acidimicrobiia bacterium]